MSFVVGDTLVVKNEDSVEHQLGPLWIPAGSSASMPLNADPQNIVDDEVSLADLLKPFWRRLYESGRR